MTQLNSECISIVTLNNILWYNDHNIDNQHSKEWRPLLCSIQCGSCLVPIPCNAMTHLDGDRICLTEGNIHLPEIVGIFTFLRI